MNKTILLLYVFNNHRSIVERLASEMCNHGITIDIFCIKDCSASKRSTTRWPILFTLLSCLPFKKTSIITSLLSKIAVNRINKLVGKYSYVDFHSLYPIFYKAMDYCNQKGIKYDITLWGSDFLRASNEKKLTIKRYFTNAHLIKSSKGVLNAVLNEYDSLFDDKLFYADFGNAVFDTLDSLNEEDYTYICDHLFPSAKGKIVVSCGYNASPAQNHLLMIDEIKKLPEDIKAKSLFVFLLSYGGTKEYIHKLEEELNKDNVSYQFLTNTISGNKLATLRKLSDITVNFQETDSFSFSLQEHLYCQNILILASWLSYQEIDNAGIFYIHTNPDSLCNTLCEVINNLSFYKSKCIANKDLIYDLISWHRMSSLWLESYGK